MKLFIRILGFLLVLLISGSAYAADMTFAYAGVATYDQQPATMNLAFTGTQVTGSLSKPGICEPGIRLTSTTLTLTGTLTGGPWEGIGTISGTWTGGDTVCASQLTLADGYPQQGTFTITADDRVVKLLRTGAAPLPSGWTYDFGPTGQVYSGLSKLPPPVLDITTATNVQDYVPVDRKKTFSVDDERAYLWVEFGPFAGGEKVQIIWRDPAGNQYFTSDYVVPDPADSGYERWKTYRLFSYINIVGNDPEKQPGTWSADVYLEGKKLLSQQVPITSPTSGGILSDLSYIPSAPTQGSDIQFTLRVQNPPVQPSYSWDMGEAFFKGQPVAWTDVPSFSYSYSKSGSYKVTVRVRDKDNYSTILDEKSWTVVVHK
jgi:hypothetical protein